MEYRLIKIKTNRYEDPSYGGLSVFEGERDIPFAIKRFYYICDVQEGMRRGHHAHRTLWQLLFCPYGRIRIGMDDGKEKLDVDLDDPSKGLLIGPGVWHTMDWLQTGSVLCVAASAAYDESDYIRDHDEFLRYIQEQKETE